MARTEVVHVKIMGADAGRPQDASLSFENEVVN
jgi:hypothetical protein